MMQSPPADQHEPNELEEHDRGLVYDLDTLDRRRVLKLLGFGGLSAGLFTLIGCGPNGATGSAVAAAAATDADGSELCARDPGGDRGPVPRRRLERPEHPRPRAGSCAATSARASGRRRRSPRACRLTIQLTVQDAAGARRWRARRSTSGTATGTATTRSTRRRRPNENYLRGVQEADDDGRRHVHQRSSRPATRGAGRTSTSRCTRASAAATDEENKIATSQIALPEDACETVYATDGYAQSVANLGAGVTRERHGLQRRRRGPPARHRDRQ